MTYIHLAAIHEHWQLQPVSIKKGLWEETPPVLRVAQTQLKKACRAWLLEKAKRHLPQHLERLSLLTHLPYQSCRVRMQKTLWGSCNAEHNISLNAHLLLLPESLMNYVLIHELCHTRHMNHSDAFWHLVACFEPRWKRLREDLKNAETLIPDCFK